MLKVLKVDAFNTVVDYIDSGDYNSANEVMNIISRSLNRDKKQNINSDFIKLGNKKELKFFKKSILIDEKE